MNKVFFGDCRVSMRQMIADGVKVQMCVTSPPYFGLRDYNCDGQLGLEATPDAYIAAMVEVFREVRRCLKDDGVLFLNIGDSYSSGVANIPNLLKSEFERGVFFYGSADPRGRSAERINILIYDKRSPNNIFEPFFASQRVTIKNGENNLCEIGGAFNSPVVCWASSTFAGSVPNNAHTERFMDIPEHLGIIIAAGDLHTDTALRSDVSKSISIAVKNSKTAFAIEIAGEPVAKGVSSIIPIFNSFTFKTGTKSRAKIDIVDNPVAFLDGSDLGSSQHFDFAVREAGKEKVALTLHNGAEITFIGIGHLFLLDIGLIPYYILLDKAQRKFNTNKPKQELGIPDMVKRALMEDGWICRQTIIWAKPNPMPESVTDRCTKSHEYIFLLSKSQKYYFDAEAIKEPVAQSSISRLAQDIDNQIGSDRVPGKTNGNMKAVGGSRSSRDSFKREGSKRGIADVCPASPMPTHRPDRAESEYDLQKRNKRSVWTVNTKPYSGAHFAVFPEELIEPCILAGSRVGDVVLDPFFGSGTTGQVSQQLGRQWIGCELNQDYESLQNKRLSQQGMVFA